MSRITVTKEGTRWVARFAFDWATKDMVKDAGFKFSSTEKLWYTYDATVAGRLDANAAVEANRAVEQSRAVAAVVAVPAPEGLAYLPYQMAGIAYAQAHANVLIADEMGLGKTIEAAGVINVDPSIKTILVVCPASLKTNWARELTKWLVAPRSTEIATGLPFPAADIVIVSYDILKKLRQAIDVRRWDMLIVDECHLVRNQTAQRTQGVFGVEDRKDPTKNTPPIAARRRIFLTGTPIVNRPKELWPLVHSLDASDMGRSFFGFMQRYTNATHNGYGWDFTGASNLPELQTRMRAKFMIRRLKADVLTELPAIRRQVIILPVNGAAAIVKAEREAFKAFEARAAAARKARAAALAAGDRAAYEAAVRTLKDLRTYAFTEMAAVRYETAVAKISQVIEHLENCLENEDKVVVFAHHHDVIDAIKAAFPTAAVVTGETPVGKRMTEVDRFQYDPDCHLFIGSIQAAGVGFTLTAASLVVFAELDWVPANISQAEARLHRIGQMNSVLVQHLVFDDSIDSRMAYTIIDKQTVIDAAMDNATAKVKVSAEARLNEKVASKAAPVYEIPDDNEVPF